MIIKVNNIKWYRHKISQMFPFICRHNVFARYVVYLYVDTFSWIIVYVYLLHLPAGADCQSQLEKPWTLYEGDPEFLGTSQPPVSSSATLVQLSLYDSPIHRPKAPPLIRHGWKTDSPITSPRWRLPTLSWLLLEADPLFFIQS